MDQTNIQDVSFESNIRRFSIEHNRPSVAGSWGEAVASQ